MSIFIVLITNVLSLMITQEVEIITSQFTLTLNTSKKIVHTSRSSFVHTLVQLMIVAIIVEAVIVASIQQLITIPCSKLALPLLT